MFGGPLRSGPKGTGLSCLFLATAFLAFLALVGCLSTTFEYRLATVDPAALRSASLKAPALWKAELGPSLIDELRLISPDRILLGLRKDDIKLTPLEWRLLDARTGRALWSCDRKEMGDSFLLAPLKDMLLFQFSKKDHVVLLAIDLSTGRERWRTGELPSSVRFLPLPKQDLLISAEAVKGKESLTAYRVDDGKVAWTRGFAMPEGGETLPPPQAFSDDLLLFQSGVRRVAGADGTTTWELEDVRLSPSSPPPATDGRSIFLVDGAGRLHTLSAERGKELHSPVPLNGFSSITSVYPGMDRLYLLGKGKGAGSDGSERMTSCRKADGRYLWDLDTQFPIVSNILEEKDQIFVATYSSVLGVDGSTGKVRFESFVSSTGRSYPVRLVRVGAHVVFLGELNIAGFDLATGKQNYRHGVDPISQIMSLNGLDTSIVRIDGELRKNRAEAERDLSRYNANAAAVNQQSYALEMSRNWQAQQWASLTNERREQYGGWTSRIQRMGGLIAMEKADIAYEKAMSMMEFQFAMMDLSAALEQAFKTEGLKTELERQRLYRKVILSACEAGRSGDYAYRPHHADVFVGLKIVHLPTGKATYAPFSPAYVDYGAWNLLDMDRGVVYYHGIGFDAEGYVYAPLFPKKPLLDARQYGSYLIAYPFSPEK